MTHFNRFTDRRIVDDLLSAPGLTLSLGLDHAIDCHEWNEISTGWNPTAPFPRCVWARPGKITLLFTERNLEMVLDQRRRAMELATNNEEPRPRRGTLSRQDSWLASNIARRCSQTGAVVPLKEPKLRPEVLDTAREVSIVGVTPNGALRRPPPSRPLPETPTALEGSDLVLPPIELPIVSLSLNLEKLSEKMSWWDEEIRRDVQAKADVRNRNKLESLASADEETMMNGDMFSIKSLLHSCTFECDCQRYPDLSTAPDNLSNRLRSRFATNIALRRVARTSLSSVPVTRRPPQSVTPPVVDVRGSGGTEDVEQLTIEAPKGVQSLPAQDAKSGSGFCSNALGQPKVREAKSIPSIPTTAPNTPGSVTLTGKRLQVASTR